MSLSLVTGAAGFVGRHVVGALLAAGRHEVRAGIRPGGAPFPPHPPHPALSIMPCDLADEAQIAQAVAGCKAVIHCAVGGWDTTVEGARRLGRLAAEAGVERLIVLSSVAVHGEAEGRLTEDAPLVTDRRDYAGAKAEAERVLTALAAHPGAPRLVLLRPTIVYGPGSALWIDLMARRIHSGRWGTLGALGAGTCNPVCVTDVAAAVRAAREGPALPQGTALFVNGPETLTWNAYFSRLAEHLGAPPLAEIDPATLRRRRLAALPAKALARLLPPLRPALAPRLEAAPAASEVRLFAQKVTYPTDRARDLLSWQPTVGLEAGLAQAVAGTIQEARR